MKLVITGFIGFTLMIVLLYFMFPLIRVCGYSMFPTLYDGDIILGSRLINKGKCKIGKIYVYKPPYYSDVEKYVIKRLTSIVDGKYYFEGDNADESYDSRAYGLVEPRNVVAVIVLMKEGS